MYQPLLGDGMNRAKMIGGHVIAHHVVRTGGSRTFLVILAFCVCCMDIFAEDRFRDRSLWVTVAEARACQDSGQDMSLVDVRSEEAFIESRISRSIWMPLYVVKTKEFLRNQVVLLAGLGGDWAQLEDEVRALRSKGFDSTFAIDGGVPGWRRAGLSMEGHDRNLDQIDVANAWVLQFYPEVRWIVVHESQPAVAERLQGVEHSTSVVVSASGDLPMGWTEVDGPANSLKAMTVLVAASDSVSLEKAVNHLSAQSNVAVLKGGLAAWRDYVDAKQWSGKTIRIAGKNASAATVGRSSGCRTCP